jgi:hypothetical protein
VEWFWNGKPLKTGSRFRTFCDFGFVILEISPVYPEDSGEYSCRAFNDYGQAVTTATMKVQGNCSFVLLDCYSMQFWNPRVLVIEYRKCVLVMVNCQHSM